MILEAHGLAIELPRRWSGRVFRRAGSGAALHAGDFQLPLDDGQFGDRSTARMPAVASFVALAEYLPGAGLAPGKGLFAARRLALPLDPTAFATNRLAHPRRGQAGSQQFFTSSGRPLCLYVVIAGGASNRRRQLAVLDRVLATLRVRPPAGGATT